MNKPASMFQIHLMTRLNETSYGNGSKTVRALPKKTSSNTSRNSATRKPLATKKKTKKGNKRQPILFTDILYFISGFNNTCRGFTSLFCSIKNKYFIAILQISLVGCVTHVSGDAR